MAAKPNSALTPEIVRRLRSGSTFLLWTFIVLLISAIFVPLLGFGYSSGNFSWIGFIAPLLGLIGMTKIRSAFDELGKRLEGDSPEPVIAPVVQEHQRDWPVSAVQTPRGEPTGRVAAYALEEHRAEIAATKKKAEPSMFEKIDWEEWIGKKLLQKVGILIVLIGMIVLLKYSFDNRIIGELGRIALAALGAILLLGAGEWFHAKYSNWSQAFTGGGLALLYFTVWAAHVFYHAELLQIHGIELPPVFAMGLYSLITAMGAFAAIRYKAQTIAWFAMLGGYLTPQLIEGPIGGAWTLVTYLAILAAGMLTLSWHAKWRYLPIAAFALTQLYLFGIAYDVGGLSDAQQIVVAMGFFLLFAIQPLLAQFRLGMRAEGEDILLILGNGAAVFVACVDALGGLDSQYIGLVSLLLAAFYVVLAGAALHKKTDDALLLHTYLLGGIGLIALAIYAEMRFEWVAAGWAPYSFALLLTAVHLKNRAVFRAALVILCGAIFILALTMPVFDMPEFQPTEAIWHPFTSRWALQSYMVFAVLFAWIWQISRLPQGMLSMEKTSEQLQNLLHTAFAIILFAGVTFEATALDWTIDLSLTFAYLAFGAACVTLFVLTRNAIWFAAAFLTQILVLLFTFLWAEGTGMAVMRSFADVTPFFHPWGAVSVLSILLTLGLLASATHGMSILKTPHLRSMLIFAASAQLWLHMTVEIQHMRELYEWTPLFGARVLSAWWVLFTVPYFVWGIQWNHPNVRKVAIAAVCLPLAKDLMLIMNGGAGFYETVLWTIVPLILATIGARVRMRELLVAGCTMLAVTVGVDMLRYIASDANLLRTIWWAIAGLAAMTLGFAQRESLLRKIAMGIFAATVIKLLVFDFAMLSTGVRIGASILTGLLLIGASYLYQRFDSMLTSQRK